MQQNTMMLPIEEEELSSYTRTLNKLTKKFSLIYLEVFEHVKCKSENIKCIRDKELFFKTQTQLTVEKEVKFEV